MYTVNTIQADDPSWFNILVCPENNQNTRNYLREQFNRLGEGMSDVTKRFYQSSREKFDRLCNNRVTEMAKDALKNSLGVFHPNTILALTSLDSLRNAQAIMQRYIMAEPNIRKLYLQQRCDGYSDTYQNVHGDSIGENHYDYQRVVNGIIQESKDEDGVVRSYMEHYSDVEYSEEDELNFNDQIRILDTWEVIRHYVLRDEDPTNILGGSLG